MPLSNQRHELFAQALAAGKTADEAYKAAGYKPNRGNAATLKANQSVQSRVEELQAKHAEKIEITVELLTNMLIDDHAQAKELGQTSAAISAVNSIGKLHGLIIDRKEVKTGRLDELSDAEIAALIREENPGLAGRAVAPESGAGKPH